MLGNKLLYIIFFLFCLSSFGFLEYSDQQIIKEQKILEEEKVGLSIPTISPLTYYGGGVAAARFVSSDTKLVIGANTTTTDAVLEVNGDIYVTTGNDICINGGNCLSSVSGGSAAWEFIWTGAITPTTTSAGIFVTTSSTIQESLRIDGYTTSTLTLHAPEICIANDCQTAFTVDTDTDTNAFSWQQLFTSPVAITPTTSNAGIFVTGSSTIAANFRVDGNVTTTGEIVTQTKNIGDYLDAWNGSFLETFNATSTSDGTNVRVQLEEADDYDGNLTMRFSSGDVILSTPTSTDLTPGTDTSPTENFVYITETNQYLEVSTSDWPANTEHIKVAYFFVPSAGFVQTSGSYVNQNWNDHAMNDDNQGHILHIAERSRYLGAVYHSGVDGNGDASTYIERTDAAPDTVYIKSTSGVVYQMHEHAVPAKDTSGTDMFLIPNSSVNAYEDGQDLYDFLVDADGDSMSSNYYNLVLWATANKTGEFAPLMINLPTCSYNTQTGAEQDSQGCDVFTIPAAFKLESSNGFLIARLTMQHTVGGGDLELISTVDLRGSTPQSVTGGSAAGALVNFPDNQFTVFDETDSTKIGAFDIGTNITTGNTRTLKWPDSDGTMCILEKEQAFSVAQTFIDINSTSTQTDTLTVYGTTTIDTTTLVVNPNENRVGIGTATPDNYLHVYQDVNALVRVKVENPNAGTASQAGVQVTSRTSQLAFAAYPDNYTTASFQDRVALFGDTSASGINIAALNTSVGDIRFMTDGINERMRIANDGNIGIGTTTPWAQLSIEGQGGAAFVVSDTSNNTDFIVSAAGDVGIGTALPNTFVPLTVSSAVPGIQYIDTNGADWVINADANDLSFKEGVAGSGPSTRLTIQTGGNVGINTATPTSTLSVIGTTYFQGNSTTTGTLVLTNYDCSGNNNGGVLTVGSDGIVFCDDDDDTIGGGLADINSSQLGQLADVSTSTLAIADILMWDGTNWLNQATTSFIMVGETASFATASADNPDNCAAGSYPLGVDANWDVESCTDATTEINSVVNGLGGNSLTCAAQSCDVDDDFLKLGGDVASAGTYDFGSASVIFEIPNSSNPTVDAVGEIALDTTDNQIIIATSTDASFPGVLPIRKRLYGFNVSSTTMDWQISTPLTELPKYSDGFTITNVWCETDVAGTRVDLIISDSGSTNDVETISCGSDNGLATTTGTNTTFTALEHIQTEYANKEGVIDNLSIAIFGVFTRE